MTLSEKIDRHYMQAFKLRATQAKNLLGVLKGEIANEQSRGKTMDDEAVAAITQAMVKSLHKMDTDEARKEIEILKVYLPQSLTEEQIKHIVNREFSDDKVKVGQIMGYFNKNHKGEVDNKVVFEIGREFINNKNK